MVGGVARRRDTDVEDLEILQEILVDRSLDRQYDLALAAAAGALILADAAERVNQLGHLLGHPAPRRGWVLVVVGEAGKRAAADVLVEELDPVKAVVDDGAHEVGRQLARHGRAQTAGIARPPGRVPVLLPQAAIVRPAEGAGAVARLEVVAAVVAAPVMADHPARAIAEGADMPAALAREAGKLAQRRL